eukprot:1483750-Rhodomonas_salina.7
MAGCTHAYPDAFAARTSKRFPVRAHVSTCLATTTCTTTHTLLLPYQNLQHYILLPYNSHARPTAHDPLLLARSTLRKQTQESTNAVQFVPGMPFLEFDFAVHTPITARLITGDGGHAASRCRILLQRPPQDFPAAAAAACLLYTSPSPRDRG